MDADARALANFKRCAEEAPEGAYEEAKALNDLITETCDSFMREVRALGLRASACDPAFQLEAGLLRFVKVSNPESTTVLAAEAFGVLLQGDMRFRALDQARRTAADITVHSL